MQVTRILPENGKQIIENPELKCKEVTPGSAPKSSYSQRYPEVAKCLRSKAPATFKSFAEQLKELKAINESDLEEVTFSETLFSERANKLAQMLQKPTRAQMIKILKALNSSADSDYKKLANFFAQDTDIQPQEYQ